MLFRRMKANNYYHGSSSASLVGVLNGGLKPFGQLLAEGRIPYSGDLGDPGKYGRGVNTKSISAVPPVVIKHAVRYALARGKQSWTPERAVVHIQELVTRLAEYVPDRHQPRYIGTQHQIDKQELRLEKKRLKYWDTLSENEKKLVTLPFALIYGINYNGKIVPNIWPRLHLEIGIPSTISLDDLVLFGLYSHLEFIKNLAREMKRKARVLPFDELLRIPGLPEDAYSSVRQLV